MSKEYDRWIDLECLPHKNCKVDWGKIDNNLISFKYGEIKGVLVAKKKLKNGKILIQYKDKFKEIGGDKLKLVQFGDLLNLYNCDYKYEIGHEYKSNTSNMKVINRYRTSERNEKYYTVKCLDFKCGAITEKAESSITSKSGCGVCINQVLQTGINDMWTINTELAKLLANPEDGYKCSDGDTTKKLNWICPNCGEIINDITPHYVKTFGLNCKVCGQTVSYPNRVFYHLLKQLDISFQAEKTFDWIDYKRYDFYLKDFNAIIEANGIQHYKETGFPQSLIEIQENDRYKKYTALNNNITDYLEIDCRVSDINFIKDNILNSKLSTFINLNDVDWDEIDKKSRGNIFIEICNLWNSGTYDVNTIGDIVGIRGFSVYKYLHIGDNKGIISYDKNITKQIGYDKTMKNKRNIEYKPILCNENRFAFETLKTCANLSEKLFGVKLDTPTICATLKGNVKSYKGFTFNYITKQEFNTIKTNSPELTFGEFFNLENNFKSA